MPSQPAVRSPELSATANARIGKRKSTGWSLSEIEQELAWRSWFPKVEVDWTRDCQDDDTTDVLFDAFVSFAESNLSITFPGKGRIPFRLRDAQKRVVRDWIQYRNNVCLKARQIGFSTLASAFVLWLTFGWGDRNVIILSRTERDAVGLLRKSKYAYKFLPEWVKMRGPKLLDRTRLTMTWENDSLIQSLPSANDPARGESAFLMIVDEWAFLPNAWDAWTSIEPAANLGGRVIGISTANGEGDFFHRLWVGSQTRQGLGSNFNGIFFPWHAVDDRDQAWFDRQCATMEAWQRAQEYPDNPEEAFIGSGNPVFDLNVLRRFTAETPVGQFAITALSGRNSVELVEGGDFRIWETPNDQDRWSYVVGADIAEGLEHGDATCAYVMCVQTGRIVACWHGRVDPDIFGHDILPAIGWYYRHAVIAPEVNNHGLTVLKALQRAGYQRIYARTTFTKRHDRPLQSMGWLTTQTSKPLLVDELGAWLREQESFPHAEGLAELRTFTRNANGKMSGSPHDDCVMALGITVQARKWAIVEKVSTKDDASKVRGTIAWWEKCLEKKSRVPRGIRPNVM